MSNLPVFTNVVLPIPIKELFIYVLAVLAP